MTCSACTNTVDKAISGIKGVQDCTVSLALQEARVFHQPDVRPADLVSAIEDAGFEAKVGERTTLQKIESMRHQSELERLRQSLTQASLYSSVIFAGGVAVQYFGPRSVLESQVISVARQFTLLVAVLALCATAGGWIFSSALEALKAGRANMHTLIAASSTLGIAISLSNLARDGLSHPQTYYDTVAGVIFIVTAGRYCDILSRRQATSTFVGLYSMLHESAVLQIKGTKRQVQASMLRAGDEVMVEPFALVPCDGYLVQGSTYVNESIMTGESMPITKKIGDFLYAGSRNGPGQIQVVVSQDEGGSFLNRLVKAVESSLVSKVPMQQNVEIITNYFVLAVFVIAGLAGLRTWKQLGSLPVLAQIDAVGRQVMTVLAAACPCALGLATPCAIMAGIDVAWRRGILLMDGGRTMEALQHITHVVLDKTGTLTQGLLRISEIKYNRTWEGKEKELAVLVCAAEEHGASSHPVGAAVFRALLQVAGDAWKEFKDTSEAVGLDEIPGHGVKCQVKLTDGKLRDVVVGSRTLVADTLRACGSVLEHATYDEGLYVFVVVDGELAASIVLKDTARPDAKTTIDALKARGYHVSMLTGDNKDEARRISNLLGVTVMAASATPETKLKHVQDLIAQGHKVAMVGDGMNDGPSLAASDVGIMMAHGTKCLSSGGGVLILNSQLRSISTLLDIAAKTTRQIKFNVGWALAYNAVAVLLALGAGKSYGITITPPIAAAMMSTSSVSVTGLGLLLRRRLLNDGWAADE
ncbi:hypothetical protein ANO11243_042630 [Dothideomycetidae sp. 11243]|nr:hypothetical protein ANO11243_042630 [fungal sp. No.11243]